MLVLSRRVGEQLIIAGDIVVTVIEVRGDGVRLGIDAPRTVRVHRAEVLDAVRSANAEAAAADEGTADALRRLVGGDAPSGTAPAAGPGAAGESAPNDDAPAPGERGTTRS